MTTHCVVILDIIHFHKIPCDLSSLQMILIMLKFRQKKKITTKKRKEKNHIKLERDQFPAADSSMADQLLVKMGMVIWLLELLRVDNSQLSPSVGITFNV